VALYADLMRGATRAPKNYFWVTELQGGTNIFSGITYLGPSGEDLRSWVWESIGAGAKGTVFWCFNTRVFGYEAGEWGLVDQQGRPSRRLKEISEIAALLDKHEAVFTASTPARASTAILFSEASWMLGNIEGQTQDPETPRNVLMATDAFTGAWMACADAGISVDVIDEVNLQNGAAASYKLLIVPGCTALEEASMPALQTYVKAGGTLLADGLCGYKTPDGWLRNVAANPLNAVFGASVADIQAVPELKTTITTGMLRLPVWFLKIVLEAEKDTSVLATHNEEQPRPALTLAKYGQGKALRLGTAFFQHYFRYPDVTAFSKLLSLLPQPQQAVKLGNPSSHLRLRALDLPDGQLLILLNAGERTTAHLQVEAHQTLTRLTLQGEEPVKKEGNQVRVLLEAQAAEVFKLTSG